ncbi:claudin-34 [Elgaria multicarinata webbii]|uniref:claudin-34 n=1 Tax=Elgaria multicarinata webbii TaxID=159646 RepID=UPI002FCCC547
MSNILVKAVLPSEEDTLVSSLLTHITCFQFCSILLAIIGWILCIISTAGVQWRVWHVDNVTGISSGIVWVGIWKVCFRHDATPDRNTYLHCEDFTENYRTLPKEIFIAQDLMALASIVNALAIGFMSFALWNVFKNTKQKKALITFFTIGGILNFTSGLIVLVPLSWNLHSVLAKEEIEFPDSFQLPRIPKDQSVGVAIYVGYGAVAFQLVSGLLTLFQKYLTFNKTHPFDIIQAQAMASKTKAHNCPSCGSSVDLTGLFKVS